MDMKNRDFRVLARYDTRYGHSYDKTSTNKNLYAICRMVPFPMTLSDP